LDNYSKEHGTGLGTAAKQQRNGNETIRSTEMKEKKENNLIYAQFDIFYQAYPKKKARDKALASWLKINFKETSFDFIMDSLNRFKKTDEWTKERGRFVPYPATWINQRRWTDEIPLAKEDDDDWFDRPYNGEYD
jgi:hypothetical protein